MDVADMTLRCGTLETIGRLVPRRMLFAPCVFAD